MGKAMVNELNKLWKQADTLEKVHKDKQAAEALRHLYWTKYRQAKELLNRYANQ